MTTEGGIKYYQCCECRQAFLREDIFYLDDGMFCCLECITLEVEKKHQKED